MHMQAFPEHNLWWRSGFLTYAMSPDTVIPPSESYIGPVDHGPKPLTEDELALLLALPRAAESNPNGTLFRLPLGPDPSMGWVDATCAESRSIVVRLADVWKSRLSDLLDNNGRPALDAPVGPGTTICIAAIPDFHGIFHLLAFWAMGCTVQYVSMADPMNAIDQLNESGCKVMLCSGYDDNWIGARRKEFSGVIVQLPLEERADQLAKLEKQGQACTSLWPAPQRPTPALILQSSGTTGRPKLLRLPLYYFTIRLAETGRTYLSLARLSRTPKTPHSHPRLAPVPFHWSSTFYYLFTHLTTATPMAFAYFSDIYQFPPTELIDWSIALDVGAIACSSGLIRLIPKHTYEAHAAFFRSLYSFSFTGSTMSNALSQVFEELRIHVVNLYGSSELGRILYASKAPYTHLRPCRGIPSPLIRPISEYGPDGSRYVELWITPSMSPQLAHHLTHGGVSVKLEPFPGDGPHQGELAVNLEDIFQEFALSNAPETGTNNETVYIHVGRHGDHVQLGEGGFGTVDGALYEGTIESKITARLGQPGSCPWSLDGVQLFGNNMTCTALVIQLRPDHSFTESPGVNSWKNLPIQELYESVEETNDSLGLTGRKRVHPGKCTLIVSSDGTFMYGEGSKRLSGLCVSLRMTHKRTLKRWENVLKFKPWLDGLDLSEA
ncbi:unnamed protein product [Rhizoctonia solani]|nr:unnamed protein product [Rhizoctonia solani]